MASWKWPNVLNKMLNDIPGINVLLNALLKQDVSGTTDVPTGAKQWVDTPEGKQFQVFNGQSWSSVGKLAHDAASVDGYSASTGTTANTIPVRDANGKLPGDITGNAATASKAAALSATNPIATGGTGATSAEQARANLVVPPKSHASSSTEYGAGSSAQYGHVKTHDTPDSAKSAATGHAFSPAGAAAMQETLEGQIGDLAGVVSGNASAQSTKDAEQDAAIAGKLDKSGGTMTGDLFLDNRTVNIKLSNSLTEWGNGAHGNVYFKDKDNVNVGILRAALNNNGKVDFALHIPPNASTDEKWKSIILRNDGRITKNDNTLIDVPTGTIIDFAGNGTPGSGYLLCNGAAVSRSTYADLFATIGTTYGAGNGSTTFNLPNFDGRFAQGSTTAGVVKEAGLPDHSHKVTSGSDISNEQRTNTSTDGKDTLSNYNGTNTNTFSTSLASVSNAIYGNSDTVQPPALTVCKFIRY